MIIDKGIFSRRNRSNRKVGRRTLRRKSRLRDDHPVSRLEVLEDRVMLTSISVGDRVWYDWNNDGLQNPNEAGPTGVTVELFDGQSQFVASTSTGADGFYSFSSEQLQPGSYSIHIIPPQGMGFTRPDLGNDDSLDSDAEPSSARTPLFALAEGQTRTDIDVGLVAGTLPETPNVITPPPLTNDSTPEIDWEVADGADRYELLLYSRDRGELIIHQFDIEHPMFIVPDPLDAPGTYQTFVRSVDLHGFASPWSAPQNFDVIESDDRLNTPSFLAPVGSTDDSTPELRWTSIDGRASYELMVYDQTRGQLAVHVDRLTAPNFTPETSLIDSNYQAFVRAISGNGPDSDWSLAHEFTVNTGAQPPEVPFIIGPSGRLDVNTPTIGWDVANRADSYEVLVYNVHSGQQVVHATQILATSFTIEDPLVAARYQVYLRAENDSGTSPWSTPMEFEVIVVVDDLWPSTPELTAPERIVDDNTPTIIWTDDGNTDRFELLVYNLNFGQLAIHEETVTGSKFTPTLALGDAPYQAFVRGINLVGPSSWSDAFYFDVETGSPPPVAPGFLEPTGTFEDNTPTISWTDSANTDTYELLVYNVNIGQVAIHETLLQNSAFTQLSSLPDASYQGFVRGFNQAGQSKWSVPIVFQIKTSIDPPPAPAITSPIGITDDSTPTLLWPEVASADTYELLVYNVDSGQQVVHETGLEIASYEFTTILKDATYRAFVRGHNSGGSGAWSSPNNFDFRSGTSGQTDANGVVQLNLPGRQLSFEFVHGTTGLPLANLGVGLALDPEIEGLGVLTVVDSTGKLPTQTIVLRGSGENAQGLSANVNEKVVLEGTVKGVLKSVVTDQLPIIAKDFVDEVGKVSDATGLALKYVNLQFGLPELPSDQRENLTPEEAVAKINQDLNDKLATHLLVLTATGGTAIPAAAYGAVIDVLNWGADRFTVSVAGDIPSAGIVKVTRKTPFGTFITYEVGSLPSNLPPWGLANFTADGKDERGLPLPPGTRLELVSKDVVGLAYDVPFENGQTSVAVPIGNYDATVRLFRQQPRNETLNVAEGGSSWDFTFQPPAGVTVTPTSVLVTYEDQSQPAARFTVKLDSPPTTDVVIIFVSSDTSEGTILSPNARFTPQNWNQEQEVLIQGVDDSDLDQNKAYTILTSGAISDDPRYQGLDVPDVTFTNVDDEEPLTPPGNINGTWQGVSRQCNPLGCQNFNTTVVVRNHLPQFTNIFVGTIFSGSGSRDFVGTVAQDTNRLVINVNTQDTFFFMWQMVGTVTPTRMKGNINILDRSGGRTTGTFNLTKVSGLEAFEVSHSAPANTTNITTDSVQPVFDTAKQLWLDARLNNEQKQILDNINFKVADLPGSLVGRADTGSISLDEDAAGLGWFMDSTPFTNEEFDFSSVTSTFVATTYSPAENRIDLLTVVMHEMGHVLGFEHTGHDADLMAPRLELGVRKLPNVVDLDRVFENESLDLLFGNILG